MRVNLEEMPRAMGLPEGPPAATSRWALTPSPSLVGEGGWGEMIFINRILSGSYHLMILITRFLSSDDSYQ